MSSYKSIRKRQNTIKNLQNNQNRYFVKEDNKHVKKMLNIIGHQGNENQNHDVILLYIYQNG